MQFNFIKAEEQILNLWTKNKTFEKSNDLAKHRKPFIFYDGPPFATGLPHYGHILSGTIKDAIGRFYYQQGFSVERRFGWDCHGLPVEYEIDKKLGIETRQEILGMGIEKYNQQCRSIVLTYAEEWERIVQRMGRWVSFRNGYRTMDRSYMASVWHVFKMLYEKNRIYRGFRVMPYSTACKTPLSNFEANQNYKEVQDPAVVVKFPLKRPLNGIKVSILAWTTTPWTLPSNCGLLVNPNFKYAIFRIKTEHYLMLENRIKAFTKEEYVKIGEIEGSNLVGLEYQQPYDFFEAYRAQGYFRILQSSSVSSEEGTGVVHCAPGFGEEDYNAFVSAGLIRENDQVPCPVDEDGRYTKEVHLYKGLHVMDSNKMIIRDLKDKIFHKATVSHRYPFCWRSDTPLIYRLVSNWFVRVSDLAPELLNNNDLINWVPAQIKARFTNWLSNARDWSISRNRFWGTPIPLWTNKDFTEVRCFTLEELEKHAGKTITDLHRESIDDIVIDGLHRVDEVLDCWFESGSMPYAQSGYPHGEFNFPANFIGEGVDQTRGWFYTLHVIATILFDQPAFKNVIVNGIVLAEDGKKMSKRLKNYPDPMDVVGKYGADALRLYLLSSPVVEAENLRFSESGVREVFRGIFIPWLNALNFCIECSKISSSENHQTQLDDWIYVVFNRFYYRLHSNLHAFRLSSVYKDALEFIESLNNWYIRINRQAMRNSGASILNHILRKFAITMAPFVPFFSEFSYQVLVQNKNPLDFLNELDVSSGLEDLKLKNSDKQYKELFQSVHFEMHPKPIKFTTHPFDQVKSVIEMIRNIRECNKISLKTPLREAKIILKNFNKSIECNGELSENQNDLEKYTEVIKSECNLLSIDFCSEDKFEFIEDVKPNFLNINKRSEGDKNLIKTKIEAIKGLQATKDVLMNVLEGRGLVNGVEIYKDEILYNREIVGVSAVYKNPGHNSMPGCSVILDLEVTPELEKMKKSREIFSFVQKLRKKAGLKPSDDVSVDTGNSELNAMLKDRGVSVGMRERLLIEEVIMIGKDSVTLRLYRD